MANAIRRYCKACIVVTDAKLCPFCEEPTFLSSSLKRFPREATEQDKINSLMKTAIENKTKEFGCRGEIISIKSGPIVTQFNFRPNHFTRIRNLKNLNEDLALVLAVDNVAIQRIPGHPAVSIMIPNKVRVPVLFQDTLKNMFPFRDTMELPLNLGIDSLGNPIIMDLAKLPHLLVAGSTGSGKSVLAKCMITSLLYYRSPKQMELVLIDPKQVELFPFREVPHVKREPASTVHAALDLLSKLEDEMRRRMQYIHLEHCENLKQLNEKRKGRNEEPLPYVVVVMDEIADLVIAEKKAVTEQLATLSSVARAAGIHLIAITQRPSVDVLSGKIKVNFPTRICFKVPSAVDSKTVLAQSGAEQLMKEGDAYGLGIPGTSGIVRIHTPLTERADVKKMLDLSLQVGHFHKVPADATKEEMAEMVKSINEGKELKDQQEKAESRSIADEIFSGEKKGMVM